MAGPRCEQASRDGVKCSRVINHKGICQFRRPTRENLIRTQIELNMAAQADPQTPASMKAAYAKENKGLLRQLGEITTKRNERRNNKLLRKKPTPGLVETPNIDFESQLKSTSLRRNNA